MKETQARRKYSGLTALFAFLLPGGGHLYLGLYGRGLTILLVVLLDIAALIRFSDSTSGSRALLLVYLGLGLPALYFVSAFDALQIRSRARELGQKSDHPYPSFSLWHSVTLVIGGIALFLLIRPTQAVQPRLDWFGDMASGILLLAAAGYLAVRRRDRFYRLGRFSSAAALAACGILLLWDQLAERNDIGLLSSWWPMIFVLAGMEMLLYQLLEKRDPGRKLTVGLGSMLAAVLLVGSAFSITQYGGLPFRWLDQYGGRASMENLSEEKGFSYTMETVTTEITEPLGSIMIDNPNGDVTVIPSADRSSREVKVEAILWVDTDSQQQADLVEQKSSIIVSATDKLVIDSKGMPYGANGSRMPRFNLRITIPADLESFWRLEHLLPELAPTEPSPPLGSPEPSAPSPKVSKEMEIKFNLNAGNGVVAVSGIRADGGITLHNRNGSIETADLTGSLEADTTSGDVSAQRISGNVALSSKEGGITASAIHGRLSASTANGNLDLNNIRGDAELETKNGYIHIQQADGIVQADTLNGEIRVASSVVGGSWDINSSIGEIMLALPSDGSYTLDGSVTFGTIHSELPLQIMKKTVQGQIGTGTYRIRVDANSDIHIYSFQR